MKVVVVLEFNTFLLIIFLNVNSTSKIYLLQEVQDEKYELLFGDGLIGQKLSNNSVITVTYIVTDGVSGNGASSFSFAGSLKDSTDVIASNFSSAISITTNQQSQNGAEIESIDSIRYFAPRIYSSQYRAVTSRDYEAIIKKIYPETESVSIIGGEELDPPNLEQYQLQLNQKMEHMFQIFKNQEFYLILNNIAFQELIKK